MGLFVDIKNADTPASPVTADENNAMMIGKSSVIPDTNPFLAADIAKLTSVLIPTTSQLYKGAQNYFSHVNGNAGLWCYAIGDDSATTSTQIMLQGARDGSNDTLYAPYSPVYEITGVEFNYSGLGWYLETGAEYVASAASGNIVFATGLKFSGYGIDASGFFPTPNDYVRATVSYGGLGEAYNSMLRDDIYFQAFTFAYNQELTQPEGVGTTKYAADQCYGSTGWLDDIKIGKTMAANFYNVGRSYPMYITNIPDGLLPNSIMTGYVSGTSYDASPGAYRYSQIRDIVGQTKFVSVATTKQATDGEDTAASFMGEIMSTKPRLPIATMTSKLAQTTFPLDDETLGWKSAHINPLLKYAGNIIWYSGKTLATGYEAEINYNRCLGIMKKRLKDDILTRIMKRDLKYSSSGVNSLVNTIKGTLKRLQGENIIDGGSITVNVPILDYLNRESSLNTADKAYLTAQRQSQLVKDITIKFPWNGDLLFVEISSILPN